MESWARLRHANKAMVPVPGEGKAQKGERRQCGYVVPLHRDRAASFSLRSLALKRTPYGWSMRLETQGRTFIATGPSC